LQRLLDAALRGADEVEGQADAAGEDVVEKAAEEGDMLAGTGELGRDDLYGDRATEWSPSGIGLDSRKPKGVLEAQVEERAADWLEPFLADAETVGAWKVKPMIIPLLKTTYSWSERRG
jgi:hypothetical protein